MAKRGKKINRKDVVIANKTLEKELRNQHNRFNFLKSEIITHLKKPQIIPKLPIGWIGFALLKDVLDLLDLTIIGIIATTVFAIVFNIALFIWMTRKVGFVKKRIYKMAARFIAIALAELIPILKFIPFTIVLVLLIHYEHTKVVKGIIQTTNIIQRELGKRNLDIQDVVRQ